jgi:hypothetical protein
VPSRACLKWYSWVYSEADFSTATYLQLLSTGAGWPPAKITAATTTTAQSKLIIFIFRQSERSNDVNNMINNNSNNNNTNNYLFFAFGEYSFAKISIKIHGATVRLE